MDIIGAFQKLLTTASRIIHQKLRTGPIWGIRKKTSYNNIKPHNSRKGTPWPLRRVAVFQALVKKVRSELSSNVAEEDAASIMGFSAELCRVVRGGVVTGFRNGAFLFLGWKTRTTTTTTTAGAVTPRYDVQGEDSNFSIHFHCQGHVPGIHGAPQAPKNLMPALKDLRIHLVSTKNGECENFRCHVTCCLGGRGCQKIREVFETTGGMKKWYDDPNILVLAG